MTTKLPHQIIPDDDLSGRLATDEVALVDTWRSAEAQLAVRLARAAARLGALDDRLQRGPDSWRRRLALTEAADLSWIAGDRVTLDRLALWAALRLSGAQQDTAALARAGWALRRLSGGPDPQEDLAAFLDRRAGQRDAAGPDPLAARVAAWRGVMQTGADLHPASRACMGFHLWALAGLGLGSGGTDTSMEAAVTAARIAAADCSGAVFVPLAMGGGGALRSPGGAPVDRLARWFDGIEAGCRAALRQIDDGEAWSARASAAMSRLSGRTPPAVRQVLADWPLVSAPMAEALTGASRAAVQRTLAWMESQGLIREVTGQGRFRMWRSLP